MCMFECGLDVPPAPGGCYRDVTGLGALRAHVIDVDGTKQLLFSGSKKIAMASYCCCAECSFCAPSELALTLNGFEVNPDLPHCCDIDTTPGCGCNFDGCACDTEGGECPACNSDVPCSCNVDNGCCDADVPRQDKCGFCAMLNKSYVLKRTSCSELTDVWPPEASLACDPDLACPEDHTLKYACKHPVAEWSDDFPLDPMKCYCNVDCPCDSDCMNDACVPDTCVGECPSDCQTDCTAACDADCASAGDCVCDCNCPCDLCNCDKDCSCNIECPYDFVPPRCFPDCICDNDCASANDCQTDCTACHEECPNDKGCTCDNQCTNNCADCLCWPDLGCFCDPDGPCTLCDNDAPCACDQEIPCDRCNANEDGCGCDGDGCVCDVECDPCNVDGGCCLINVGCATDPPCNCEGDPPCGCDLDGCTICEQDQGCPCNVDCCDVDCPGDGCGACDGDGAGCWGNCDPAQDCVANCKECPGDCTTGECGCNAECPAPNDCDTNCTNDACTAPNCTDCTAGGSCDSECGLDGCPGAGDCGCGGECPPANDACGCNGECPGDGCQVHCTTGDCIAQDCGENKTDCGPFTVHLEVRATGTCFPSGCDEKDAYKLVEVSVYVSSGGLPGGSYPCILGNINWGGEALVDTTEPLCCPYPSVGSETGSEPDTTGCCVGGGFDFDDKDCTTKYQPTPPV